MKQNKIEGPKSKSMYTICTITNYNSITIINLTCNYVLYQHHTQLLDKAKSWNLKDNSPAVSLSSRECEISLVISLGSEGGGGNGSTWVSSGRRASWTSDACDGNTEEDKALNLELPPLEETKFRSQRKTCRRIGTLVCLCKESFWLSETVS